MSHQTLQFDRTTREAIKQLASKRQTNVGGVLLGKRMVHKNHRAYNRQNVRLMDRRAEY